jgi:hypothetical protein
MPGPAPKPDGQRRRRNAVSPMTRLPAEGRHGDPPPWPLSKLRGGAATREAAAWAELWATPQAAAWERLGAGAVRAVARYTRLLGAAEFGDPKAAAEVRLLEDRLGLTPLAMLRLRWEIAADEVEEKRTHTPAERTPRRRLKVADSGAVAGE